MFVARFTFSPEYDVQRNWSGWMGVDFATELEAYEFVAEHNIDSDTLNEKWEKWQDEDHATWHHRDHSNRLDFLQDVVNVDIRYNEVWGRWQIVHHNGLSCFSLDAETVEDAVSEAKTSNFGWFGFGQSTEGKVKYVCPVDGVDYLHIFECEYASNEV